MTEEEYSNITDLARLYAIQQILMNCHFTYKLLHENIYKEISSLQGKTKDIIIEGTPK